MESLVRTKFSKLKKCLKCIFAEFFRLHFISLSVAKTVKLEKLTSESVFLNLGFGNLNNLEAGFFESSYSKNMT